MMKQTTERTTERTSRMNYLMQEYPNMEFTNGKVTLYKRHSRDNDKPEIVFSLPMQNVEYLREGILVLRVSDTVKEIFSISREEEICNIPAMAQVQIITENRKLKGYLVNTFTEQIVYNKIGQFICSAKNDEALLQPTELMGSRTVSIKKLTKDGKKSYISFDKEEVEVKPTDVINFLTCDGQTVLSIERENQVTWYNDHFNAIGSYDAAYTVVETVNRIKNEFAKRLPDYMPVEKTWTTDPDTEENYPHYSLLGVITWERHDSILVDEARNIFYVVKPNSGDVEAYAFAREIVDKYESKIHITPLGKFKSNSEVPVLELKG